MAIVPAKDAQFAEFFSWGSRTLKKVPPLDWLLVGPNAVPDGWQHIDSAASEIPGWVRFAGDDVIKRNLLPFPRLYRYAGIMAVEDAEMSQLQANHPGSRRAMALKLGEAVVVGALATHIPLIGDRNDPDRLLTAARIGHDDLEVLPGQYDADTRQFYAPETVEYVDRLRVREARKFVYLV